MAEPPRPYALYVWTGLVGSLAVLQFWLVLGDLYTLTQAKRLYGLVGAGGLLGAGRGPARAGPRRARSASALVLAAAALVGPDRSRPALAFRRAGAARRPVRRARRSVVEGIDLLAADAYVRGLAGLVARVDGRPHPGRLRVQERGLPRVAPAQLGAFFAAFTSS